MTFSQLVGSFLLAYFVGVAAALPVAVILGFVRRYLR